MTIEESRGAVTIAIFITPFSLYLSAATFSHPQLGREDRFLVRLTTKEPIEELKSDNSESKEVHNVLLNIQAIAVVHTLTGS